ncbi:MAG: 4'-phosphopantetheinyl transferase superfamily protein [Myxococcota bacterium]
MVVGNDIVDLALMRERPEHPAFAERVCSEAELGVLYASRDRARALWSLFAAKEAAYKALSKLHSVRFVPRAFCVDAAFTTVQQAGDQLTLRLFHGASFVHASVFDGASPLWDFARRDSACASDAVRVLARCLAGRYLHEEPGAFSVVRDRALGAWDGYGPPRLLLRGRPVGLDVSLSHHGRYVACAVERRSGSERDLLVSS